MPPPPNLRRRRALADAAIDVLGRSGIHGLSHHAVDERANLPPGTTTNYFRTRAALLQAAAERVVEQHRAEMETAKQQTDGPIDTAGFIRLLAASLRLAATEHRVRYLAIYELGLEATRRPALQQTLARITDTTVDFTVQYHDDLGLGTTREDVQTLITLYGGALLSLVIGPPEAVTPQTTEALARAMVTGITGHSRRAWRRRG